MLTRIIPLFITGFIGVQLQLAHASNEYDPANCETLVEQDRIDVDPNAAARPDNVADDKCFNLATKGYNVSLMILDKKGFTAIRASVEWKAYVDDCKAALTKSRSGFAIAFKGVGFNAETCDVYRNAGQGNTPYFVIRYGED